MADSSKQPIRGGADLDALRAKLQKLNAEAAGVLDRLSAEADTLTARLAQANKQLEAEAIAEEQVSAARAKRPPPEEAASAKGREASNAERLAAAEERAAAAARLRADAELAAARAAQESAAAVSARGIPQIPQYTGTRFVGGPGGVQDVYHPDVYQGQQRRSALDAARAGDIGAHSTTAVSSYSEAMAQSTAIEREAAAATAQHASVLEQAAGKHEDLTSKVGAGNAQLRTFDREIETTALRLGQIGNQFERNGYLTSEFISAAAKGQVTIRELGTQVGGTIAKFAGWTAAATAVYGAVRAVQQLGEGALASESGVNQLNRVVTVELPGGAAAVKQQFRDLSHEFNLPISDVTDAAYGMAKAFHGDLPQALEATKDALFAVKVGELSAADATRYLTAIINGFRLGPQQLHDVFDALNQVQNRFGGSLDNVAAGVAKAAGQFKAAGGDYLTLVKLVEAGVKVTGRSGENVGTAFSRSAGRVLTEAGRKAISDVGLDPDLNYPELFGQALAKSKGASPQTKQAIARALVPSGGQFAAVLGPILNAPDLLGSIDQALEKRAGSARRERQRLLQSPQEQLKRLSTDAQQLGSALGDAGALTPLLALVGALRLGVEETTQLVELVEKIAGPFDKALVPLLQIVAAIKLARRFDVGSSLPVGTPGRGLLTRPAGAVFNAGIESSTAAVRKELTASYQQALRTQERAQLRANAAAVEAQLLTDELSITTSTVEQERLTRRIGQLQGANLRYSEAQDSALVEANLIQAELAAREEQLNVYRQNLAKNMSREAAALAADYVQLNPIGTTKAAGNPEAIGGAGDAAAKSEAAAAESRLATAGAGLGASTALSAEAKAAEAVAARGEAEAVVAKTSVKALGLRLFALVGEIGLIAFTAYEFAIRPIIDATHSYEEGRRKAETDLHALRGGLEAARRNAVKSNKGAGFLGSIGEFVKHPFSGGNTTDFGQLSKDLQALDAVGQQQSRGRLLDIGQVRGGIAQRLSQVRDQGTRLVILRDGLDELQNDYIAQVEKVAGPEYKQGKGAKRAQAAAIADFRQKIRDAERAFNASTSQIGELDLKGLGTFSEATGARLQLQGPTRTNVGRLRGTLRAIISQSVAGADPAEILKLVDQINQQATNLADRYGQAAGSEPLAQARGRAHGVEIVRKALNRGQLERELKAAKEEREGALRALATEERVLDAAGRSSAAGRALGGRTEGGTPGLRSLRQQADKLREQAAKAGRKATAISQLIALVFGALKQADDAAGVAAAEAARYDAQTEYLAARAGGGLAGDRVRLGREGGGPYKGLKRGTTEWYQHQTDILNTQGSIAEQEKQQAEDARQKARDAAEKAKQAAEQAREAAKAFVSAQADYAASLTADPVREARIRYREAERLLRYASGRTEQLEGRADVNNRHRDLQNAQYQSRLNDIEFHASIGKLSKDAEIAQLEALRKRIHGNKELRRQITQEIYNLKHQAAADDALDINVGDLHLPTIYDVRRLKQQGLAAAAGTTIQQTYHFSVRSDSDVERLGGELDRIHGGGVRAAQRSAGLR